MIERMYRKRRQRTCIILAEKGRVDMISGEVIKRRMVKIDTRPYFRYKILGRNQYRYGNIAI